MSERPSTGYPGAQRAWPERPREGGGLAARRSKEPSLATATNEGAKRQERRR